MNKKNWLIGALNCETYSSFVTARIRLSLCRNATRTIITAHSGRSLLNKRDVSDKDSITLRSKNGALQKISGTLLGVATIILDYIFSMLLKDFRACGPWRIPVPQCRHWQNLSTQMLRNYNENFVNAHMEAAADSILTKLIKRRRVPWETLTVKKNCDEVKTASLCNRINPTNANAQKQMKVRTELSNTYLKEQIKYIQDQINKIRNAV